MKKILVFTMILAMTWVFMPMNSNVQANDAKTYKIAWSHYTGWEFWQLAKEKGILDKWAAKKGVNIELTLINDYVESMNLYTAGQFDGCTMTNMDALTIPAVGGVDSEVLIIGDFSNGNDGFVVRNWDGTIEDLQKREIKMVKLTVSHYMWARWLGKTNEEKGLNLTEKDFTLINVSDAEVAGLFASDENGAVVTWNPPLISCRQTKGAKMVFDSSQIPGEIIDTLVVRTDLPEPVKEALVGAWYETMQLMSKGKTKKDAISFMAEFSGTTAAEFKSQLTTTRMFYGPAEAAEFANGQQLKDTMEYVRTFCFEHDLFGDATSKDLVGIQFADGTVMGDPNNIKLRFPAKYMQKAADNQL